MQQSIGSKGDKYPRLKALLNLSSESAPKNASAHLAESSRSSTTEQPTNTKQEDSQVINEEAAAPVPSQSTCSKSGLLPHENPPAQAYGEDSKDSAASSNPKSAISAASNERKFNLVLYGVDECSEGTRCHERAGKDRKTALKKLRVILTSLEDYSIRDCIRIGKYSPNGTRPRPLLVKFLRACDVNTILYKLSQGGLPAELSGIAIKHHMTPSEVKSNSILLRKRLELSQEGVDKQRLKIKGNKLLQDSQLLGEVVDGVYRPVTYS